MISTLAFLLFHGLGVALNFTFYFLFLNCQAFIEWLVLFVCWYLNPFALLILLLMFVKTPLPLNSNTLKLWLLWNLKAIRKLHSSSMHDHQLQHCPSILVSWCGWLICNSPKSFWNLAFFSQTGEPPSLPTALQNYLSVKFIFLWTEIQI